MHCSCLSGITSLLERALTYLQCNLRKTILRLLGSAPLQEHRHILHQPHVINDRYALCNSKLLPEPALTCRNFMKMGTHRPDCNDMRNNKQTSVIDESGQEVGSKPDRRLDELEKIRTNLMR